MAKYSPKTKDELIKLVNDESVNLGDIDTSAIDDMSELFQYSERTDFSGIEKWDTSKVKTMESMFCDICDKVKLPSWYLKWVEKNTDELLGSIGDAEAICEQLKVAYIIKEDLDFCVEEVLEKYPSRLQATWALKDKEENGELDDDKDYYAVIGYEPKKNSVKDLEPLVGMDMITADWLLRKGIQKAILFDNTDGCSYGGTIGKIFGVYDTRLEAIKRYTENEYPDEWWNLTTGEMQSLGYQPNFEIETFIGKDFLNLMEALRWVEWLKESETYWWLEVIGDSGKIVRIVKTIYGSFDEATKYKYELPLAEDGRCYVLGNNAGEWLTSLGGEERDEDEDYDEEDYDEDDED